MSFWRLLCRSLVHHWRMQCAVALGVAAATAVLTGALVVGDSVRGSMRALVLERLGQIDTVLVAPHFFRAELAGELAAKPGFTEQFTAAVPIIYFPQASMEAKRGDHTSRAAGITVVGGDDAFWNLDTAGVRPKKLPGRGEIVLNEPLARELVVQIGDLVTLRLPSGNQVPEESALGKRHDTVRSLADLKVVDVIPARGLGRYGLSATQQTPRNAFVSPADLQQLLDQPGRVNAIFVGGESESLDPRARLDVLNHTFAPKLIDYGFHLNHVRRTYREPGTENAALPPDKEQLAYEYFSVTSDQMVFERAAATAIESALATEHPQASLAYLANMMTRERTAAAENEKPSRSVPYSIIVALESGPPLGPLVLDAKTFLEPLGDDEIALTSWAANDLAAKVGDTITVTYYEPETTHSTMVERSHKFKVREIVPLVAPATAYRNKQPAIYITRPLLTNDPDLTPSVPGITDAESVRKWSDTFPFIDSKRFGARDEDFWEYYRTTPKAYVSLTTGRKLWASRFGETTLFRVPARPGLTAEALEQRVLEQLLRDRVPLGSGFLPVKAQGLLAASGTTPFDLLFLGLSMFIIAAALVLTLLLFRLNFETRASETGLLLALGLSRRKVMRFLLAEGLTVAAVGGLLGALLGVGYAWLMIAGLNTWWQGAVAESFLALHVTAKSVGLGFLLGLAMAAITIVLSLRSVRNVAERRLLAGQASEVPAWIPRKSRVLPLIVASLVIVAAALAFLATRLGGEAQAGAFVGSGFCVLFALLMVNWLSLRAPRTSLVTGGKWQLVRLARRNAGRHAGRSALTIGLVAVATFLIVAMGAFRAEPTDTGIGGCVLMATSDRPLYADLNNAEARAELLRSDASALDGSTILPFRSRAGDDASCRNLYQPAQPRILGVTPAVTEFYERTPVKFAWAATAAQTPAQKENPWRLLTEPEARPADAPIPVVLDKNTAMYSLHLYGGVGEVFSIPRDGGGEIRLQVVGLLANTVLQGSLLIDEADFIKLFPREPGYRVFLIHTPTEKSQAVSDALEDELGDLGFNAFSTREQLQDLLDVQNTYLSTFQSLGALGLLLGTFGLATVQLRNVVERRSELALLQACGFRRSRLAQLVLCEHALLLVLGLASGLGAALVAVAPHFLSGTAHVRFGAQLLPLAAVFIVGLLTGFIAVRAALKAPLLAALRGS